MKLQLPKIFCETKGFFNKTITNDYLDEGIIYLYIQNKIKC